MTNVSLAVQMPGVTHSKLFFTSHSNGWHYLFEILVSRSNGWHSRSIHYLFERLASSVRNFAFAVQTAGIIRLKFLQCRSNIYSICSKFFHSHSNGMGNCFERLEHTFLICSLSVRQLFVLPLNRYPLVTFSLERAKILLMLFFFFGEKLSP